MTGKRLVLIVENEEDIARLYAMLLEDAGYDVEIANTLTEGEARISQEPLPDCCLLDLILPNGQGVDLLDGFENRHPSTEVPIVAVTGYPVSVHAVKKAGAQALLQKPVSKEDLLATVKAIIEAGYCFDPSIRDVRELRAQLIGARGSR